MPAATVYLLFFSVSLIGAKMASSGTTFDIDIEYFVLYAF